MAQQSAETRRAKQREYMRKRRAALKAAGVKPNEAERERKRELGREYMRRKREAARQRGEKLPSDRIHLDDPEKWREIQRRSYQKNIKARRAKNREKQAARRSTPWGRINNSMWTLVHQGVLCASTRWGGYTSALGYTWADLRAHLEAQFEPDMNWGNWGEVWDLDHITPLSSFQYTSLRDPLFREAWRLENLRPRYRAENLSAGGRLGAEGLYSK